MIFPRFSQNARWPWIATVVLLVFLDQTTKLYFSTTLLLGEAVRVTEWFNFVHVRNTGAAFSFLADAGGWQRWFFIGISVLVVGIVSVACLAGRVTPLERWLGAFVVGGGSGNLGDRIHHGAVVDFLDFHWGQIHWPAFNLADVFIVCAAMMWCLVLMKAPPHRSSRNNAEDAPS